MTTLSVPTLVLALLALADRRRLALYLSLAGVTASGAAVVVGLIAVPTFYAVAAVVVGVSVLRAFAERRPLPASPPGVGLLAALLGWGVLVTCLAPFLFAGLRTVTPLHTSLAPGVLTSSNIAQIVYLALGIGVVVLVALDRGARVEVLGVLLGAAVLISLWRWASLMLGVPFPEGFFDNSPGFAFIETAPNGALRFRGIFSEPAALSTTCLVAIAYCASRLRQSGGGRRVVLLGLIAVSVFLGITSTSTTFLVAGVALVVMAGIAFVYGFLSRVTRLSVGLSVGVCLLILLAVWLLPVIADFVQAAVQQKLGGASYEERSSADADSYRILVDTWGFGVGLGAGRASSLLPTTLSTVGVVGVMLLIAAVVGLVARSVRVPEVRPAIWALAALLTAKIVAGPDLSDPTGIMWISLGLMSGAVLRGSDRRGDSDRAFDEAGTAFGTRA